MGNHGQRLFGGYLLHKKTKEKMSKAYKISGIIVWLMVVALIAWCAVEKGWLLVVSNTFTLVAISVIICSSFRLK